MLFYLGRFYALKYYSKFGNTNIGNARMDMETAFEQTQADPVVKCGIKNKEIINWHSMLVSCEWFSSCFIEWRNALFSRNLRYLRFCV